MTVIFELTLNDGMQTNCLLSPLNYTVYIILAILASYKHNQVHFQNDIGQK